MFPFTYAPTFEYPLSGNVLQSIAPDFGLEIEGIPEVEHEVITTVASYGTQLGKLTDAVLELAEKVGLDSAAITEVREIAEERGFVLAPFPADVISSENWTDNAHVNAKGTREKAEHIAPYARQALAR